MPIPLFDGPEFLINTTTAGRQFDPTVTSLSDGRFVVAWTDQSQTGGDRSGSAIRGQIFETDGTPLGSEFLINTTTLNVQDDATITALSDGRFVVTWSDRSQNNNGNIDIDVRGQIFSANGAPAGSEFIVHTTTQGNQWFSAMTALSGGRFVVTWSDSIWTGDNTSISSIRGQIFSANGAPLGSEFSVGATTNSSLRGNLTTLPDGRIIAVWTETGLRTPAEPQSPTFLRGQIFTENGAPLGSEFLINTTSAGGQSRPAVTALSDGRYVVAWTISKDNGPVEVRGQVFATDGTPFGEQFTMNTRTGVQGEPAITALPDGRYVVAWSNSETVPGRWGYTENSLRGRILSDNGAPEPSEFILSTTRDYNSGKGSAMITTLSDGRVVLIWVEGSASSLQVDIRGRIFGVPPEFVGTDGDDAFTGSIAGDAIFGLDGNDTLVGEPGDDTIRGGAGDDIIYGGLGGDNIGGGADNDLIHGGEGGDLIWSGFGNDTVYGGTGQDKIIGGAGQNELHGDDGNDLIYAARFAGSLGDVIYGGTGNDMLFGGVGAVTIHGGADNDLIYSGAGNSELYGGDGEDHVLAFSRAEHLIYGGAGNDLVRSSDGDDTIHGDAGNDYIGGGADNDLIFGGDNNDTIFGGFGNDTVQGGAGGDTLIGGAGQNELYGDDGDDLIYAASYAGSAGDLIYGGAGNDTVRGGGGADTIYGGLGNDDLGGGAGSDVIFGSAGANTIWGGLGHDTIHGGSDKDVMNGGPGADVFVFALAAHIGIGVGRDVITDFQSGVDRIDLLGLNTTFNGAGGLLGGGQASFYYFAAGGLLIGDQNGDGAADWVLELTGAPGVGDFLL